MFSVEKLEAAIQDFAIYCPDAGTEEWIKMSLKLLQIEAISEQTRAIAAQTEMISEVFDGQNNYLNTLTDTLINCSDSLDKHLEFISMAIAAQTDKESVEKQEWLKALS